MGKEDMTDSSNLNKSRFHGRMKSSSSLPVSEVAARGRIMSVPGPSREPDSRKGGGGRSWMEILRLKKRKKSSSKLQDSKLGYNSEVG